MVCCIKKYPLHPLESCTASPSQVEQALRDIASAISVQSAVEDEDGKEAGVDAFANNKDLPRWKQRCIQLYVACVDEGWQGSCYDCIRTCEGQQDWPFDKCFRGKRK